MKTDKDNDFMKAYKAMTHVMLIQTEDEFTYDEYLEWCEEMGIEPAEENSVEYYQWCNEESQANYEADRDNLEEVEIADETFVVTGSLGLWDGKHEVHPTFVDGLLKAIDYCSRGSEDMKAELDIKAGVINVYGYHHDGTNCFEIRMLNKNGLKWKESAERRGEDPTPNAKWLKKISRTWIYG